MMRGGGEMTKDRDDIRFDVPLYTLAEAAHALDVPATTFATWARGYDRAAGKKQWHGDPIVTSLGGPPRQASIPFVGLAEGMVLAAVRKSGVPLQRVRPALAALAADIGVEHALASRRLYTDGAELLYDYAESADVLDESDADVVRDLVVVRSRQRVFAEVVEHYLERISYGSDDYASKIRLPAYDYATVVADPERSFGQPIFERSAVPVSNVLDRFWAGEDIDAVSDEFGVPRAEIEDVLRATSRRAA
jgi:uncharacterized protein (DUF433 family)